MTPHAEQPTRLTLLHVFPSFAVGGAQVRFASVAARFGRGYRHHILAMDGNLGCRERLAPELDVTFPPLAARKSRLLGNLRPFRRALRALRPNVLVTHNWGSIEWGMANIPSITRHIHIEDGFGPEERDTQLRRRVLTRRVVLARSVVVLPSRALVRIATERWRLDPSRVRYIPNGIDVRHFARARTSGEQTRLPGEGPVIGTVAALRPEKSLVRLLLAFRGVLADTQARLVIAGDGPERARLERFARELGVAERVQFTGHVADPAPLYAAFDVFALSSDTEQMPLSVIEAMAAGLPVASTDVGDVRAMLAPENEPFIGPLDEIALAGAIRRLLHDPRSRTRIGTANRAKAEREFDQEAMFLSYAALFEGRSAGPATSARSL